MTDPRHSQLGDPESGAAPFVAPITHEVVGAPPGPETVPVVTTGARIASAVLPGLGHLLSGVWTRGVVLLFTWGALLGLLFFARSRVFNVRATGTLDDVVAVGTLVLLLLFVWGYAFYDLIIAPQRRVDKGDSQWRIASRHFKKSKVALAGLFILLLLYLIALLAPLIAPYDPIAQRDIVATSYLKPSAQHWLGTDRFGRDILSRILYGARISLSIGFIATLISVTLGTVLGALAGFFGGKIDALLMRFTDMVLAFPRLVLLIMIVALFSPSVAVIITVLGLTQWPNTTRIVRGDVLSLREREFIQAAHALGMGKARIIFRHLIPNVLAPVIVTATLGIGNTIVLEAGLSFLGLGVQPPIPSWGNMVADGRDNLLGAWWVATFPGLTIVLTVLAFNLVGDGLRDALDPRLRS
ncbi:MAG TPA: oligopeptide ABC transporter permease [Longimicrobiales bacterium]|nr:oligopeptide ABC transporter permease [Longimicrobiales bacterium]